MSKKCSLVTCKELQLSWNILLIDCVACASIQHIRPGFDIDANECTALFTIEAMFLKTRLT